RSWRRMSRATPPVRDLPARGTFPTAPASDTVTLIPARPSGPPIDRTGCRGRCERGRRSDSRPVFLGSSGGSSMLTRNWLLSRGLACVLALLLVGPALAADSADDTPRPDKEPPDPPGTSLYMNQFRALFDAWDLNKDGFLDKEELAKAF